MRGETDLDSTKESGNGTTEVVERRLKRRHAFSATTEVTDLTSGARSSTRAADLSQRGCFLDSLNPFSVGANIRVRITWGGTELTCTAVVRDSQPGMGMGVAFTDLDDARKAIIEKWIERLGSSKSVAAPPPPLSETSPSAATLAPRDPLAMRLIELLQKKGLLNSTEVASLLRDKVF
jgi:hypothetical protein